MRPRLPAADVDASAHALTDLRDRLDRLTPASRSRIGQWTRTLGIPRRPDGRLSELQAFVTVCAIEHEETMTERRRRLARELLRSSTTMSAAHRALAEVDA